MILQFGQRTGKVIWMALRPLLEALLHLQGSGSLPGAGRAPSGVVNTGVSIVSRELTLTQNLRMWC